MRLDIEIDLLGPGLLKLRPTAISAFSVSVAGAAVLAAVEAGKWAASVRDADVSVMP
jgi:hypothetical protein